MRIEGKYILPCCPKCRRKMKHRDPRNPFHGDIYECIKCKIAIWFRDVTIEYVKKGAE